MKRFLKRTLAVLMTVVMLIGIAPMAGNISLLKASAATTYKTGDIVKFGSYPQSRVMDSEILSKLDSQTKNWRSYNYYNVSDNSANGTNGTMTASDYMSYADFIYGGDKYRAVTFSNYRPYYTGYRSSALYTNQDENGYNPNNVYYFKYEPLRWRVLDAGEGLVMSENIIDSQAFNNYLIYVYKEYWEYWGDEGLSYYASDYANSSIRDWLNNDFCNTAFSSEQQGKIQSTNFENKCKKNSRYDSSDTDDNIFLLSYWDVWNTSYGFSSDVNKRAHSTDYAKCQGATTYTGTSYQTADGEDTSTWWLRTPVDSGFICRINCSGADSSTWAYATATGVRPALRIDNLDSLPSADESVEQSLSVSLSVKDYSHYVINNKLYTGDGDAIDSVEATLTVTNDTEKEGSNSTVENIKANLTNTKGFKISGSSAINIGSLAYGESKSVKVYLTPDWTCDFENDPDVKLQKLTAQVTSSAETKTADVSFTVIPLMSKIDAKTAIDYEEVAFSNKKFRTGVNTYQDYLNITLNLHNVLLDGTAPLLNSNILKSLNLKDVKITASLEENNGLMFDNDSYKKEELINLNYLEVKELTYKIKSNPKDLINKLNKNSNKPFELKITLESKDIQPITLKQKIIIYRGFIATVDGFAFCHTLSNFGTDKLSVPPSSAQDAFGISLPSILLSARAGWSNWTSYGGVCFGLSTAAVANYLGLIPLDGFFARKGTCLHDYSYDKILTTEDGKQYFSVKDNNNLKDYLYTMHMFQFSKELQEARVFDHDPSYSGLLDYLNQDNASPLIVNIPLEHAFVTDTSLKPLEISPGEYLIPIYDPNHPASHSDLTNPHEMYDGHTPYLYLYTKNGDFKYRVWNPELKEENKYTDEYYLKYSTLGYFENIEFYDISRLDKKVFERKWSLWGNLVTIQVNDWDDIKLYSGNKTWFESKKGEIISKNENCDFRFMSNGETSSTILITIPEYDFSISSNGSDAIIYTDNYLYGFSNTDQCTLDVQADLGKCSVKAASDSAFEIGISSTKDKDNQFAVDASGRLNKNDSINFNLNHDRTVSASTNNKELKVDLKTEDVKTKITEERNNVPVNKIEETVKSIIRSYLKIYNVRIDDLKLNYKKSATLNPTITADEGVKYTVKYESSNPKVATVDQNGKVTATKRGSGSATITCTVTDEYGNVVKDTCKVDVKLSFGQWLIVILLFGWIWY